MVAAVARVGGPVAVARQLGMHRDSLTKWSKGQRHPSPSAMSALAALAQGRTPQEHEAAVTRYAALVAARGYVFAPPSPPKPLASLT